jgi:transglutaminase-like putative cysteine protease
MVSDDTLEALQEEDVDLLGETKRLLKIKCEGTLGKHEIIHRTLWTDEKGLVWKSANIETGEENFRTSEKVARKQDSKAFDLGLSTIVKVAKTLEKPHDTRRIVYLATLKHRNPSEVFPNCGSQSVKAIDEHIAEIVVRRITPTYPETIDPVPTQPESGDGAANSLIQSDAKIIVTMADSIVNDERDPIKVALALESGVRQRMTDKNFSTAFGTAADVARTLSGDCTEHAVLLAALCRARKIPARVAAGLVYVQENKERKMPQGVAYHMWTEAWLNGRWVPLDATLGRGGIGAAHIKLSDTNLDGVSPLEALLPVMNVLGQLELEIVEVDE